MQLGTLLPLGDIGGNPATVREYPQAAEAIGYDFVRPIMCSAAVKPARWSLVAPGAGLFHDPLVLFGYLAGCTEKLGR